MVEVTTAGAGERQADEQSPISMLSTDLLIQILQNWIPDPKTGETIWRPLAIEGVCTSWRKLLSSPATSRLWSRVDIDFGYQREPSLFLDEEEATAWFFAVASPLHCWCDQRACITACIVPLLLH